MPRQLPHLLLACCFLPGCMALDSAAVWSERSEIPEPAYADFNLNDSAERQAALAAISHEMIGREVAKTPPGSLVRIVVDFDHSYVGTVLSADRDGIELMNCLGRDIVPGPDGRKQVSTSHVPFQSFRSETLTNFGVFAPPRSDFPAPKLGIEPAEVVVAEVVFRSGRRQPGGTFAAPSHPPADVKRENIPETPAGSLIRLVDDAGQRYTGTLLSAGPDTVELMNCIRQEIMPGPHQQRQLKTSHVPFQSFPPDSVAALAILAPPPPDFVVPELGVDCEDYILAEFVFQSGRSQVWGMPAGGGGNPDERAVPGRKNRLLLSRSQ